MEKIGIPIYLSNAIISRCSKVGNTIKELSTFKVTEIVCKGYNIEDIKKRTRKRYLENARKKSKLNQEQFFIIKDIELLSYHGLGVNDSNTY